MTENIAALSEKMSETTINSPDDTSGSNDPFVENPHKELQDFLEISERNLEAFKDDNQELASIFRKDADWNKYRDLFEKYELLLKEIYTGLEVEKIEAEGEIDYSKRRLLVVQEDIEALNARIHEGAIKVNELQKEKSGVQEKIVEKHSAFQQAIKYYKCRFNVYVNVTKSENAYYEVQICFFTQKFDDSYSATLLLNDENQKWKLENVKPVIEKSIIEQLQRRLEETNDINEILCAIRMYLQNNMQ